MARNPNPTPAACRGRAFVCLLVASALWLPWAHHFFRVDTASMRSSTGVSRRGAALAKRHLSLWSDASLRQHEVARMRRSNAEWDFMGRTYLALAFTNLALRDLGERPRVLGVLDAILTETLKLERDAGFRFFLMNYAKARPYVQSPARSMFVDSEIALMLGARLLLGDHPLWRASLRTRVETIRSRLEDSPTLNTESYPDECWLFDNTLALAALKVADHVDGSDHSALLARWVQRAKTTLIDPKTGLLVSSYKLSGEHLDGPEGSSIWMAAHALQLVDPKFAADQYARAKNELSGSLLGFGYSREWPASWKGVSDIDAGMVIPLLEASPGASGLALVGAAGFSDQPFLDPLFTALELVGFPVDDGSGLRYVASNQVGDAVALYATVQGPLWATIHAGRKETP